MDSEQFPFESKWIELNGNVIHYVDEGQRTGQVLLFVHPALGCSFSYRKQMIKLRDDFRCRSFDFPGFGLSFPSSKYSYTLSEQADIVRSFVEALNLKSIIIWANDAGGPSAISGLAPISDTVRGLVVGGTFGWSLKDYPGVTRMLRIVSSPVFRLVNRYANLFGWPINFAIGTHSPSKTEKDQILRPLKERNSRNRPLRLFRTFMDLRIEKHSIDR